MGAGAGFDYLAQAGVENAQHKSAYKQQLKDEELQGKIQDLIGQRSALVSKISTLDQGTPEYQQAFDALKQVNTGLVDVYHPQKNPGAIQKFGHLLTDHLGIKVGGETLPERRQDKADALAAIKDKAATTQTQQQVAGAPLSPEQQAVTGAKSDAAGKLASIQSAVKNFATINPDATPDEKQAFLNDLVQKTYGTTFVGNWERVTGKVDGEPVAFDFDKHTQRYRYPSGESVPPDKLAAFIPDPKTRAAVKKGLKFDPVTGEVVDQDTAKRYSISDIGSPDMPPEVAKMFHDSKSAMDEKQRKALALADERGRSFAQNRFGGFVDPNNPTQVIPVPYGEAAKRGLHLATGAQYQTMEAMLKSATSGPIGNEIGAFSTSLQHADLLGQAALALNNGDVRWLNRLKNDFATQFAGEEAPTDFNTIAGAYTREVTKALSSGHITDAEIAANGLTIPRDASPAQISGAVNAYKNLMRSKINIRLAQIQAGMAGVPFTGVGGNGQPIPGMGTTPQAGGKQKVSIAKAKLKPQYKNLTDDQVKQAIEASGKYVAVP